LNNKERRILEKTHQEMSNLNVRLHKMNPLCYSSGAWRI